MIEIETPYKRWTVSDLELLPENDLDLYYEIVNGELFVQKAPHWHHQETCDNICRALTNSSEETELGQPVTTPGVLFSERDHVIPDVVWISNERLALLVDEAGHLTGAPDLVVEVLSAGAQNERRDREVKLKLYEAYGVREYWLVDWCLRQVEIYRREQARLHRVTTLYVDDEITSLLLPGFACPVRRFFYSRLTS